MKQNKQIILHTLLFLSILNLAHAEMIGAKGFLDITDPDKRIEKAVLQNTNDEHTLTDPEAEMFYFDGEGDYIEVELSDEFYIGENDFTFDFWVLPITPSLRNNQTIISSRDAAGETKFGIFIRENKIIFWWKDADGQFELRSPAIYWGNTLHHIAIVRHGTDLIMFIDGVRSKIASIDNMIRFNAPLLVGAWDHTNPRSEFNGYLNKVRITNGLALWDDTFYPDSIAYSDEGMDPHTVLFIDLES